MCNAISTQHNEILITKLTDFDVADYLFQWKWTTMWAMKCFYFLQKLSYNKSTSAFQSKEVHLQMLCIWLHSNISFLLCPSRAAVYCDQFVCQSVCEHISGTAGPIFTKFVVQIPCGRGSFLLWWRCDTLCTSGFMYDATFGHSGLYGNAWLAELQYRVRVRCLRMSCFPVTLTRWPWYANLT